MTTGASFTIPKTVYVGDTARLVATVVNAPRHDNLVVEGNALPSTVEFEFLRAEWDAKTATLFLDFRAFSPGRLEVPAFTLGGMDFSGLEVVIASILEEEEAAASKKEGTFIASPSLSPPAAPLAVPGTVWYITGGIILAGLAVLVLAGASFERGRFVRAALKSIRRRLQYRTARKFFGRCLAALGGKRGAASRETLALVIENLSRETRVFLSALTGIDCRSFVSEEFLPDEAARNFFARCDVLRFGGVALRREMVEELVHEGCGIIDDVYIRLGHAAVHSDSRTDTGTE